MSDLLFITNSNYRLVEYSRLDDQTRSVLGESLTEIAADDDFYGVLLPQGEGSSSIKAVCQTTALLFLTLETEGPLPAFASDTSGSLPLLLRDLVAEGIIEMSSENGIFVAGPDALALLDGNSDLGKLRENSISNSAIEYAIKLDSDDPSFLTQRLYSYNSIPVSNYWEKKYSSDEKIYSSLNLDQFAKIPHWQFQMPSEENQWFYWQRQRREGERGASYKLYISPHPSHLNEALPLIINVLVNSGIHSFKLGNSARGLLRPDKMVAYSHNLEGIQEAASKLELALENIPAQGVPFTGFIDSRGMVSWGMDPPEKDAWTNKRESWRFWIAQEAARCIQACRGGGQDPFEYTMKRLDSKGVDVIDWKPKLSIWN